MTVAIVLAAGKGTRMNSDLPKVLHPLAGRPLVNYPLAAARQAGVQRFVVVVGHGAQAVRQAVLDEHPGDVSFAVQPEQNGTGHAVLCALPQLGDFEGLVLILSGDVPLLRAETLRSLVAAAQRSKSQLALLTFRPTDPTGYGRIIRDDAGDPVAIREHADASDTERELDECNAGIYCVAAKHLRNELPQMESHNAQGEIYLTDLVAHRAVGGTVETIEVDATQVAGINTREQLLELERFLTT